MYSLLIKGVVIQSPDEVSRPLSPLDPNAVRDLELQAKKVASSLDYIMENLHNSLHAVSLHTRNLQAFSCVSVVVYVMPISETCP